MRCIEITTYLQAPKEWLGININMRCIEMNIGTLDVYGRPTININMRCIEMEEINNKLDEMASD